MTSLVVPIAMAAVLAVAWALPFSWWSVASISTLLTALLAAVVWPVRTVGWRTLCQQTTMHAACCVWGTGAIGLAYAVGALNGGGAVDGFTRLGYPFLVRTGLALPGGELVLLLVVLVSVTPVVLRTESPGLSGSIHRSS